MNISVGAKTDTGKRANNEDSYAVLDVAGQRLRADGALVIADGMGGRNFGERASQAAVETVRETLTEMLSPTRTETVDIGDALDSALRKANAQVYELAGGDDKQGMGTTCVAAVFRDSTLTVAHAGDSRAYLLRDGQLLRLTDDHSYVAEQVKAGVISEEGARKSRFRNVITRAVGIEPTITPDVAEFDLEPGDRVLLCTDGLTNAVDENVIAQTLAYAPNAQAAADKLVQIANKNGGKDNITAVVAALEDAAVPAAVSSSAPRPRRARWPAAVAVSLLVLLLAATVWLASLLRAAGYHFVAAPPFLQKPVPPPPPAPPNLALADYAAAPAVLYFAPVRGDLLALSAGDDSLTVVTLSTGQVLRLTSGGKLVFKYPLPAAAPAVPLRLHMAADPQGNIYIADAVARTLRKYRANGQFLRPIARGLLQKPESLTVGTDGTVYVIDGERLKVIRAK